MANEYYYYSKRRYFEKLSAKYSNLESYSKLLTLSKKLSPVTTDVSVKPELGSDMETTLGKYGKPLHLLKNMTPLKTQILFYKFIIGGHKTKCELHFYKNKLFLFNYTFSYLTPEDRLLIMKMLSEKYLDKVIDLKNYKICDKTGHEVFIQNLDDFIVNYMAGQSDFFHEAESIQKMNKEIIKNKNELNKRELLKRL